MVITDDIRLDCGNDHWRDSALLEKRGAGLMENVEKLSRYFSALIRAEYTDAELSEVNRRNAQSDMGCATHDFRDANAFMYGAWCALNFAEPDLAQDSTVDTINQAWNTSRAAQFKN